MAFCEEKGERKRKQNKQMTAPPLFSLLILFQRRLTGTTLYVVLYSKQSRLITASFCRLSLNMLQVLTRKTNISLHTNYHIFLDIKSNMFIIGKSNLQNNIV